MSNRPATLYTPPHHNYPSDPEEPRLLIAPPEHRLSGIVPCIWDPNRTSHRENASPGVEAQPRGVNSATSFAVDYQGSRLPAVDWNADARAVSASPFAVPVSSFMPPEKLQCERSLAAYQLMMYLQHPFFPRAFTPLEPMYYASDDRFVDVYSGRGTVSSEPVYQTKEPSSDGTFKKSS